MNNITKKIIFIFSENESKSLSTTEIAKSVFKDEYEQANKLVNDTYSDSESIKKGKRQKAQIHRKILYYLNKLVEENTLFVSKIKGKGEKYYVLNPSMNSEANLKNHTKSIAGITNYQFNMVESFEHSGQINKFDSSNWYRRLNAVLLEPLNYLDELYDRITESYSVFNDVIGVNDFQKMILKNEDEEVQFFLKKINTEAEEYKRHITLIISLKDIREERILNFLEYFQELTGSRINAVIYTDKSEFSNKKIFFKKVIKKKVHIQNKKINTAPILIGKSGVYTIKSEDYKYYQEKLKDKLIGILYGSTTVTVDYNKLNHNYTEFRKTIMNSARSLIIATSIQRGKSDLFFFNLNKLNKNYQNEFYRYSSNKIRIRNYFDIINKEEFSELLSSINEEIFEFLKTEETIFTSCGVPTKHNIELSLNGKVRLNIMDREKVIKSKKLKWFEKLSELANQNALLVINLPKSSEESYSILKELMEVKKIGLFKPEEKSVKENTLENYI